MKHRVSPLSIIRFPWLFDLSRIVRSFRVNNNYRFRRDTTAIFTLVDRCESRSLHPPIFQWESSSFWTDSWRVTFVQIILIPWKRLILEGRSKENSLLNDARESFDRINMIKELRFFLSSWDQDKISLINLRISCEEKYIIDSFPITMANLDFENKNYIKIGIPCKNSIRNSVSETLRYFISKIYKKKKVDEIFKDERLVRVIVYMKKIIS